MDEKVYKDLVDAIHKGNIFIGIDRAISRKFFTDVPSRTILESIGENLYFEKIVVMTAFILAPVFLVISIGLTFYKFGLLGGGLSLIMYLVLYFLYLGNSSRGNAGNIFVTVLIACVIIDLYVYNRIPFNLCLLIFLASLWLCRFVYISSVSFVRLLVLRNYRAWNLFNPQIKN